jgi:hypothetical protein
MMRAHLDRIIARTELQVEQHCVYAISLAPYGDHVKRAPDLSTFRGYLRFPVSG